jgi:hypothetical protein
VAHGRRGRLDLSRGRAYVDDFLRRGSRVKTAARTVLCHQKYYSSLVAIEGLRGASLTRKRSVTLAGGLIAEVEELAGSRGFSAAMAEALTHWIARTTLRRAIEAYEAEAGEIT